MINISLGLVPFILLIVTDVLILTYLGKDFQSTYELDPEDWKRKWIVFFAYFQIIGVSMLLVFTVGLFISHFSVLIRTGFYEELNQGVRIMLWSGLFLLILFCIFSFITSLFTILYLGPTFDNVSIDPNDWKRKWIIFFSWFSLILRAVWLLIMAFLPVFATSFVSYNDFLMY